MRDYEYGRIEVLAKSFDVEDSAANAFVAPEIGKAILDREDV